MFSQQLDQSNSQNSSQQSQTFLTVPRLIQQESPAYLIGAHKQIDFEDPNSLQKSEHRESLEEGDILGSKISIEKREINRIDEVEQNYKSLKLFQIEMQNVSGRKLMINTRKISDQSEIGIQKQTEQIRKPSSPTIRIQECPLYEQFTVAKWPKRWFYIIKFLSKLMSVQPKILKQSHLMLIDDKAFVINHKIFLFNPFSPFIVWSRYIILILYILGFALVYLEFAFAATNSIFIIFFGFTIIETLSNYFIGVYIQELYTENRWQIAKQYLIYDIFHIIICLLTLFYSQYFIIFLLLRIQRLYVIKTNILNYTIPILIIHISKFQQIIRFLDDNYLSKYIISLQWTIYQITNSGNTIEIEGSDQSIQLQILSILTTIFGYLITIYLITNVINFGKQSHKYKVSAELNENVQRYLHRDKIELINIHEFQQELKQELREELFMPLLNKLPFSKQFLQNLCQKLKSDVYSNGTILQMQNQMMDRLIFLMKGNVAQCIGNKVLANNQIPIQYFYCQMQCPIQLKCLSESLIAYIDLNEFLQLIKLFNSDFQKYCMLKDNYKIACHCCGYRNHTFHRCNHVFYVPNFKELILLNNTSEPNNRMGFCRDNGRNRINALMNKNLICITAISFAIINQIALEVDLTNEVMGRFQGTLNNFEDSILNDYQEDKSSRQSMQQKIGTFDVHKSYNQGDSYSSQTYFQSSIPVLKVEEREASQNSRRYIHKHVDYSATNNSIKANLVKSSNSNELQVKRTQKVKKSNSSCSLNKKSGLGGSGISQVGSIIPQQDVYEDDLDQVCNYEYYYPSYNIEYIANALNHKLMSKYLQFVN
ncbi:unnamed protein product (macronuclear) [Paramecium tetraurelia]|uniref:Cyclic nucleotide-binding domain-containing protein n=1 Tax=Paramecium tetraurelia TaxID=5888 RepID=A0BGY6_PARTE|nr:uncharacterized protein GSPATT00028838001 [Paramecium tetraurelia]CAK57803.1 unnamed protein product [Paramecium tetraurelia]|eukprot:XP_001425201.1 hypothetical protein (macronuclear) [Paramecium tetraurelia strain d4-2]